MMVAFLVVALARVQESAVAYVPKPGGPPDTSAYMWAGYAISALVFGGYTALLLRRHARERAASGSHGPT